MAGDDEKVPQVASWSELLTGGLPQLLIGPAGKSISRLIAGATDIPAAWLEQKAQAIRDVTDARSKVMLTLADKAAQLGVQDEKLLERGLDSLLGKAFREQTNREAVAKKVVEDLADKPPPSDSPGPSDDWLNVFESYADKATSEHLRETLAKVLAGEIRRPSSFSLHTLQFLAVVDQPTANAAKGILGGLINRLGIIVGSANGQRLRDVMLLRDAGLLSSVGLADVNQTITLTGPAEAGWGSALLTFGSTGSIVLQGMKDAKVVLGLNSVSRVAREIVPLLDVSPNDEDLRVLAEVVPKDQLQRIDILRSPTSAPEVLWRKPD